MCPSGTGPKYEKAREWNTPVINREWLAAIATTGAIPSVLEYTVVTPVVPRDYAVEKDFVTVNVKGKGKADDNDPTRRELRDDDDDFFWGADKADGMMNDITNGLWTELPLLAYMLTKSRTCGSGEAYHERRYNTYIQEAIRKTNTGTYSTT